VHATAVGTPSSPPPWDPIIVAAAVVLGPLHRHRHRHRPRAGTSLTQGALVPRISTSSPVPPSPSGPHYHHRRPPAGPHHHGESFPVRILFSMTPPHCRQQEPTELPLALHYLTIGVQYAYEKDSENTGLHCCENVLIELDQWCSSFVLKWPLKKRNRFYET
jgi:hypothetical protein